MAPSVGKKISGFVALMVLLSTGAMGYISYTLLERTLAENLRKDTLDASALLSSRVANDLRHVAEKSRILAAAALEEFKNPDDQYRFLEDHLLLDEQLIAISLYRRSTASDGKWTPVFRLTHPEDDPATLSENDFHELDLKYPLDYKTVATGAVDVSLGVLKNGTPLLRLALPLVRKKNGDFSQLLQMEIRQERITAAFAEATAHFSYLLDGHGRMLTQTDPTHFTLGEDLSQLPIFQMARTTEAPGGSLDYQELPGGMLQYGSFHKVGYGGLVVISQASRAHVLFALRTYTQEALALGGASAFLAMAFALLASWGIIGSRLRRMAITFRKLDEGKYNLNFPERHSDDEIGVFAQTLQRVCENLGQRERVHGTYAKLKNKRVKNKLEEGQINFKGERLNAMVMHCHLHGIEQLIAKAEPENLIHWLNRFNQSISQSVEKNQGIVDHIHGGSIVAAWGVPLPDKKDADHALSTCFDVREAFKILNEELKTHQLPELRLAVGVHYGPVVAGQVGSDDRLEYTAFGDAIEIAARIQTFTDQFGTDILLTGPALRQAPQWYSTEKLAPSDDANPELHELVGRSKRSGVKKSDSSDEDGAIKGSEPSLAA